MISLGIDPALRNTGICLLDGLNTKFWTFTTPKGDGPAEYLHKAILWWEETFEPYPALYGRWVDDGGNTAVELCPPTVRKGRTKQGHVVGFAAGVWSVFGAMLGPVRPVLVSEWRRVMLKPGLDGDAAKKLAVMRAEAECKQIGAPMPSNHHEAEAYCIARWIQIMKTGEGRWKSA